MLIAALLRSVIRTDSLRLIDAAGHTHMIGDGSPPCAAVRLRSRSLGYRLAVNPGLLIGEAYMSGQLAIEQGTIYDVLALLARNYSAHGSAWLKSFDWIRRGLKQYNPVGKATSNVAHHYDLSGALYDLFLDHDRQYSCAYFMHPDDTLEAAQDNKKRHIAAKLRLDRPGLKILDVGSGWGGLALYLARLADGADVTGVTLSTEQYNMSQARSAQEGLGDRVRFHLRDYREVEGCYDRIVSVGMFEHVGKRNYGEFFNKLRDLLDDDGVALLHTIGYSDVPGSINPFIRKYIFPGADLPSLSEIAAAAERSGLFVTDVEVLRLHYAKTLRLWRERFIARWNDAARIYDERFCRMWEFYLALCEVGFRYRTNVVYQMQLAKRMNAVPITRDYMLESERQMPVRA